MPAAPFTIVFPVFDGITQLDYCGPAQFLSQMPGARLLAAAKATQPILTDSGFSIVPAISFADCPQADILCVPGGHGVTDALQDPAMMEFIAAQAVNARWVTSVCTGAFLLGAAGLLQGRRATTHWAYTHLLPLVGAVPTPGRVVEDGNIITAGGVTSGIDFALTLIARMHGDDVAKSIQLACEYNPAPPFVGGHPDQCEPAIVAGIKSRVFDNAAARLAAALG